VSEKTPRPRSPGSKAKKSKAKKTATPKAPTPEERFVQDLIARGEAGRRDQDGNLPPGVTHEIVDDPDGGPPTIVRRRFSIS
jgi:hypothetical protein